MISMSSDKDNIYGLCDDGGKGSHRQRQGMKLLICLGVDYQNHEWRFGGRRWSLVMVVMNPAATKVLKLVAFVSSICVGNNTVLKHGLSILNDPNKRSALGLEDH
ncbi:hypothetical protein Hanom_Chr09g00762311 [Helianthus anomalus]